MSVPGAKRPTGPEASQRRVDRPWPIVAVAVVVVVLAAWRTTLGMSFLDDGYYAAGALRLASGAHLFVDEMFVQSLGFLAVVPFAQLWVWLFGLTGVVAAMRVFYVVLAAVAGTGIYRLLRHSFGRWASLLAVAAPLLAPPYNLLAVSYDTSGALGMILGCVLVFAAIRDSNRRYATAAGAAAAFGALSYPPLAVAAIALLVTLAIRGRDRRLTGAMVLGAAAVVGTFAVWLFATTSLSEIGTAYSFIVGTWVRSSGPQHGTRILLSLRQFIHAMSARWIVPLWVWFAPAAIASYLAGRDARIVNHLRTRAIAITLIPVSLLVPTVAYWLALGHRTISLETVGGNFLIAFAVFSAWPMFEKLRRTKSDLRDLTLIALPASLVGFLIVVLSSASPLMWGSYVVGLGPLIVAVLVWWATEVDEGFGSAKAALAVLAVLLVTLVLLFGYAFKSDRGPLGVRNTISSGAYAGITVGHRRAAQIEDLARVGKRWVTPTTTVAVVALPGAYPIVGGIPLTNVVWLDTGRLDDFMVAYLNARGQWPDVVIVPLRRVDQPATVIAASPFFTEVLKRYRLAERAEVAGVAVYISDPSKVSP